MIDESTGLTLLQKVIGGPAVPGATGPTGREQAMPDRLRHEFALRAAIERFDLIAKLDELWSADVASGRLGYDEAEEREITALYQHWLATAEKFAAASAGMTPEVPNSPLAAEFTRALQDARGICTPDEVFFAGPGLELLRDEAVAAYHAGETVEIRDPRG